MKKENSVQSNISASPEPVLTETPEGLTLIGPDGLSVRGDFTKMKKRLKGGIIGTEMLPRAAKLKGGPANPLAIDATAGLGEDSILLAAAGFRVWMFERNEVIAALLKDALRRAREDAELLPIVSRMELIGNDSIEGMKHLSERPDVVFLDPMFPERKKSALIKKKFQLLHELEEPCKEETELLEAAIAAGPRKVVVKRPEKGEYLAGRKPDYSLPGKAIRYDCFVFSRNDGENGK